ncbi:MAG: extracellular solute-binding protein, partial [Lachnospiraceae bacterium]|nr:extracellular solute-binding protein [Lachnospiraceae bacterium]
MKSKRIIALLTAMIMSASLLAACGGNSNSNNTSTGDTSPAGNSTVGTTPAADAESGPAALEPITLTMFVTEPGEQPPMSNKVVEIIRERTGVTLEIEYLVGDMNQKVGILIASGSYPDIIGAGNARGEFLEAGALLALDDYLPNYPNLWRHYGEYADRLRGVSEDGKIYILDIWGRTYRLEDGEDDFYEAEYNGPAFWIQKDVLAWDNYANPTTLDDFFDLLARYYEAHPTIDGQPTLPFEVFSSDRFRSFTLRNAPQHLIGGRNEGDVVVNDDYSIEIYQNKDYAKRYYAKLNEVYKQGLIDQETFTRSFDQYVAAVSQGRVLAMFDQHWSFEQGEFVLVTEDKINRTYVPLGLSFDGPALPYNRVRDAGILG